MTSENTQTDLSVRAEINLYYDLFVPETAGENAPLLVAVHGYGAHKRYMMREARLIAPENCVVASIQAPNQHFRPTDNGYKVGFGWLTDFKPEESITLHQKFVTDVIEKTKREHSIDEKRIFLYGFSQACALNFRFALTFPDLLRGIVGVCGGVPSDLETNEDYRKIEASVFYLYSRRDEFYALDKYERFDEKLSRFAPDYESKIYDAAHEITDEMRRDVREWLAKKMIDG